MNNKQSIQSYHISFIAISFLVVFLLGFQNIKNSLIRYQSITEAIELNTIIDELFNAVQSFGFERGRVNVVLNYKKDLKDMSKNIDFFIEKRKEGETSLDKALKLLSEKNDPTNALYIQKILSIRSQINQLRSISDTEINKLFLERDHSHSQRWFNAMSNYIHSIIKLSSILVTSSNSISINDLHFLRFDEMTMKLRDHAGPVCSYLAAAILSPDKFNDIRRREIEQRDALARLHFEKIKELGLIINVPKINEQINRLEQVYYTEFYKLIKSTLASLEYHSDFEYSQVEFTKKAVEALKEIGKLLKISKEESIHYFSNQKAKILNELLVNIGVLLFILSVFAYSFFVLHRKIYSPVKSISNLLQNLIDSDDVSNIKINESKRNDEIGDLEKLLIEFKNNKIALIEEKEHFKKMFKAHTAILLIVDPETGKIIDYNESARQKYGYTDEEMSRLTIFDINRLDPNKIHQIMSNVKELKEMSFRFEHYDKSGDLIHVEVHSTPINVSSKRYLFSIIHDISERITHERDVKKYQKELETLNNELSERVQSEIQARLNQEIIFSQLFDSLDSFVSLINSNYEYVIVNKAYCERFGVDKDDIVGQHVARIVSQKQFDQRIKKYLDSALSGQIVSFEAYLPLNNSDKIYVETVFCPFLDANKSIKGVIVSSRDITETYELKEEVRVKENLMIQQSKLADMGNMISAITHQWKQPLNIIGLITQMYQINHENDPDVTKLVESINEQIQYMSTTVNDFRELYNPSKIKKSFDVNDSINKVINLLFPKIDTLNITINFTGGNTVSAYGLRNEFIQVMMNLINNAKDVFLENGQKDGQINISTSVENENVKVIIQDNGGGIKSELLPDKLFEQYITTKGDNGTGIGLSMSKTIIEKHMNGSLSARNLNKGAEFTILIPTKKDSLKEGSKSDISILYVEDNEFTRIETTKLLNKKFKNVLTAENGEDGLQKFEAEKEDISLVITDIDMPKMNGVEMSEEIRRISPDIPIIVLTAIKEDVFKNIGFNEIIEKPIHLKNLLASINNIMKY